MEIGGREGTGIGDWMPAPGGSGRGGHRRDRHGRGFRGPVVPPHLPGYRTRRARFDELVRDCAEDLLERFPRRLEHLQVAVEDVPPADPSPWEAGGVALGRYLPADRTHPPRVVLYRRPISTRTADDDDLELFIRQVLSEQVASMLGKNPEDIDPGAWEY